MNRLLTSSIFALILIAFISIGCQGNPASPHSQSMPGTHELSQPSRAPAHHCLGFYSLTVDTETWKIEALPTRSADWHFNVTGILNGTMGVSPAIVPGESDPPNGLFVLDVTLTHPFATKPQFTGFDVKGILMTPGSLAIGSLVFADIDETRLENADGYTRWWNPTEFTTSGILGYTQGALTNSLASQLTATVNPYKMFADILDTEYPIAFVHDEPLDNDEGRAVFGAGNSNTRRYRIRFPLDPGPQVVFGYAIDCAWDLPAPNPPGEIPDDFPIEANQPEAFYVGLIPTVNTLFYDSEYGVGGGVLRLQVNVHDWQGQLAGDIPGEISSVRIFAPDLMPGGVDGVFLNEIPIKARYTADLTGLAMPAEAGEALVICRVGSTDGSTYQQGAAPAPSDPLSAYQVISVDIPDPVCATDTNNDFLDAVEIIPGDGASDQVCSPDDQRDYYFFDIPPGFAATGAAHLYTAAEQIHLAIYDETHTVIDGTSSTTGHAILGLGITATTPGTFFLEVTHGGGDATLPYYLEIDTELQDVIPDNPIDVTPSTLFVEPDYVWIHDPYAILIGRGIWVYDITDPTDPVQVYQEWWSTFIDAACFQYPYCYLVHWISPNYILSVIDFSDPLAPVVNENVITIADDFADITMNSTHLYVGTSVSPTSEVLIYNYITDPFAPSEIGSVTVPYEPQVLGLLDPEGPDTHLIVGSWNAIRTYNVENVLSITPAGSYIFAMGPPRGIATWGNYIYVAHDFTGGGDGWLHVLEQTTVPNLQWHTAINLPGSASQIAIDHPNVYIGDGIEGLTVCDITNPIAPSTLSTTPLVSLGLNLDFLGDHVFVVPMEAGLQIMDVSTPSSPTTAARLRVLNNPGAMLERDPYIIVNESGTWYYGIKTIDIADPPSTFLAAEYPVDYKPTRMAGYGDLIVAGGAYDWELLSAADPLNLVHQSDGTTSDFIRSLGLYGTTLYVSYSPAAIPEVEVWDVTTPSAPTYEGSFAPGENVNSFCFVGDYMYMRTHPEILVYSIADPLNPVPETVYSTSDISDMTIQGDYLYMTTPDSVEIADISSPELPTYVGHTINLLPDWLERITVEGQFAYVTMMGNPAQACWIWPPDNPDFLGPLHPDDGYGFETPLAHDGFLYLGTEAFGLRILDLY